MCCTKTDTTSMFNAPKIDCCTYRFIKTEVFYIILSGKRPALVTQILRKYSKLTSV